MSPKGTAPGRKEEKSAAEYYKLHTQAVADLVGATKENSPKVTQEELKKYRSGGLRLADWVKLLLVKWWFPAASCYFFFWGLGLYFSSMLDVIVITAVCMGFVTDLLTNNVIRFIEPIRGMNDKWMMYPQKGFVSLPLNVLHSCAVMFLVYTVYATVNAALVRMNGLQPDAVSVGVEPILFGLLWLAFDMLFIAAKHLLQRILSDARKSAANTMER